MKDNQKAVMQQMLQDVVTHFSKDPVGLRAVNCTGGCFYTRVLENSPDNIGCAIGMYLTDEQAEILENGYAPIWSVLNNTPQHLPDWMRKLHFDFLTNLQNLHDFDSYWNKTNISIKGKIKVEEICKEFHLDFKKIKFKK